MLSNIMNSISSMQIFRGIRTNAVLRDVKPAPGANVLDSANHIPTEWERKILVWTKTFPNKEAIPQRVSLDTMQTAMSRGRIRVANFLMIVTVVGCLYVVVQGKRQIAEVNKQAGVEHNDLRRQITAEYRASLNENEEKK